MSDGEERQFIIEVAWDRPDLPGVVGPFGDRAEAEKWGELNISNGAWMVVPIAYPYMHRPVERPSLADELRGLARDPHARAVLSKAFREAALANAAEALHALADGLDGGTVLRPRNVEEGGDDGV